MQHDASAARTLSRGTRRLPFSLRSSSMRAKPTRKAAVASRLPPSEAFALQRTVRAPASRATDALGGDIAGADGRAKALHGWPREELSRCQRRSPQGSPPTPHERHPEQQEQQDVEGGIAQGDPQLEADSAGRRSRRVLRWQRGSTENDGGANGSNPALDIWPRIERHDRRQCANSSSRIDR